MNQCSQKYSRRQNTPKNMQTTAAGIGQKRKKGQILIARPHSSQIIEIVSGDFFNSTSFPLPTSLANAYQPLQATELLFFFLTTDRTFTIKEKADPSFYSLIKP